MEVEVDLNWAIPEHCGDDQTLAFQVEGKLAMGGGIATVTAQYDGHGPAPGSGLASTSTTMVRLFRTPGLSILICKMRTVVSTS